MYSPPFSITSKKKKIIPKHVSNPSSTQTLLQQESSFDLHNIEQFRNIENNLEVLKNKFNYLFLRKFFRHNYQLVWHSKFQSACINFLQQFNNDELLPFIDNSDKHHPQNSHPSTSNIQSTSYNPYVSLHPGFQNFPTNSFQSTNIPPNPLPPSNSTLPVNPYSSYPSPHFQMTPSVSFATLSDP